MWLAIVGHTSMWLAIIGHTSMWLAIIGHTSMWLAIIGHTSRWLAIVGHTYQKQWGFDGREMIFSTLILVNPDIMCQFILTRVLIYILRSMDSVLIWG